MAITGVMAHWREVLLAPLDQAAPLLHQAALSVLEPLPLAVVGLAGWGLIGLCRQYWSHPDPAWRLAASALATGQLVNRGSLSVTPEGQTLETLIDQARRAGRAARKSNPCASVRRHRLPVGTCRSTAHSCS